MALEKITIATEEKQDKILQDISLVSSSVNQLAQKTVDTSNLANKEDIRQIKEILTNNQLQKILQVKRGDETDEQNCNYLLIGVSSEDGSKVFDKLDCTDFYNKTENASSYKRYVSKTKTVVLGITYYLMSEPLFVKNFDMYGRNSAIMLKLNGE